MTHFDRSADLIFQLKGSEQRSAAEASSYKNTATQSKHFGSLSPWTFLRTLSPRMGAFGKAVVFFLKLKKLLGCYFNGTKCLLQPFQTMNVESASKTSHVTIHQVASSMHPFLVSLRHLCTAAAQSRFFINVYKTSECIMALWI
ncbi:hypothetical protein H1C71_004828 [Ictidomys tridecemlineatus]|nr:hypothetical protein H1C71_004828 [Ictidomys tridecemlineatus]